VKRSAHQPTTEALTIYAGVYVKAYTVRDAGTLLPQHSHEHAHLTAITAGSVRAWRGAELLGDYHAPALVKVAARELHQFLTLTPSVGLMCIHAVGEADDVAIAAEHVLDLED
jgi:hypothetical protein